MYTYRQLKEALNELTEEQLDLSVTVRFQREYFGVEYTDNTENDPDAPFDEPHPVLVIFEEGGGSN